MVSCSSSSGVGMDISNPQGKEWVVDFGETELDRPATTKRGPGTAEFRTESWRADTIRTRPRLRRAVLYPTELRARGQLTAEDRRLRSLGNAPASRSIQPGAGKDSVFVGARPSPVRSGARGPGMNLWHLVLVNRLPRVAPQYDKILF